MKALIAIADGFEDSEFFYPYYRLLEEGIEVDVAGPEMGKVTGKHGYEFEAGIPLSNVQDADYDLLVLPGGKGPETVRLYPAVVKLAETMVGDGRIVAAICHGPQILVSADVLHGRCATCWEGVRDDIKAAGADYVDEEVVVDGNLITSRSPADLPAFFKTVLASLRQAL